MKNRKTGGLEAISPRKETTKSATSDKGNNDNTRPVHASSILTCGDGDPEVNLDPIMYPDSWLSRDLDFLSCWLGVPILGTLRHYHRPGRRRLWKALRFECWIYFVSACMLSCKYVLENKL